VEQAGSQKWSCEGLINEQSPAPSTQGQAYELEMSFSFGETVSFSLFQVSPRQHSAWISPWQLLSHPTSTWAFSALFSAPPPQAEGKYSIHVFGHQFCPEGMQLTPQLC
jgi:hypothetical protein